ncbi:MAG: hypothetical protein NC489_08570 [Ruminococcus flavefaciens]|nr:hypothetical protein [Ruminococcus flavefaciens]
MSMTGILNEPENAPITVFSVQYYQQWKHRNAGKDDVLFIVYKDDTDTKKIRAIKHPSMEIYFANPDIRDQFRTPREYLPIEDVYSRKVPAVKVLPTVWEELSKANDPQSQVLQSIYMQSKNCGNRQAMKEIFKWPYTLFSDMGVEEYYRIMLGYHYNTMRNHIIDKAYLDIEADTLGLTSSEQAANLDKVNACTVIFNFDPHRKQKIKPQVFTFLLRNHRRYPQQKHFEEHLDEFIQQCHETIDHTTVTKGEKSQVIDFVADYHIELYDDEGKLLNRIFEVINKYRPDTCSVWNIAYDIPKIAARMEANGINYVDAMCDSTFPKDYRFVEMNIDTRPGIEISDKKTYIRMASTTSYIDQMQSYGGLRKGMKQFGSSSLDNISNIELGLGKLKFTKPGVNVLNAAVESYWEFVLYNIIDVVRQVMIDIVTNDCMSMVYDMNQSNTSLENLTKQTRYQRQIYYTNYLRKGFVPGNNPNISYVRGESEEYLERMEEARLARERADQEAEAELLLEKDSDDLSNDVDEMFDENTQKVAEEVAAGLVGIYEDTVDRKISIPGGMVADPDFNTENGIELIKGVKSKHMMEHIMDMDFASEYPWAKYTRSLSKSTQIGRLIIPEKISGRQNTLPMGQKKRIQEIKAYLPGGEFVSDYLSQNVIALGNVWFNLPTITDLHKKLLERKKAMAS